MAFRLTKLVAFFLSLFFLSVVPQLPHIFLLLLFVIESFSCPLLQPRQPLPLDMMLSLHLVKPQKVNQKT